MSGFGSTIAGGLFKGFDGIGSQSVQKASDEIGGVDLRVLTASVQQMRLAALSITIGITEAINDGKLPENSLPSEYLDALILSELGVEEGDEASIDQSVMAMLEANVADAMATLGVSDNTISDIFSDDTELSDAAIEAAAETVQANMPDGGEAMDALVQAFTFGFDPADMFEDEPGFDSMKNTAGRSTVKEVNGKKIRYKGVKVVRNGKVTVVNKRLPGQKVVLSSAQKQALNKLHAKPITGNALSRRMRSVGIGKRNNLYK